MSNKITYTDKVALLEPGVAINQWQDDDANEVKDKHNLNDDRITNIEENQITGVEVYTNYADLPATGTLLVSYKIANDGTNPDLNGYYHWSGSAYIKDAGINEGAIDDNNDLYDIPEMREAFTDRTTYDSITSEITPTFTNGTVRGTPFSGWGAVLDKINVSFNAIQTEKLNRSLTTPEVEKWNYVKLWVKNDKTNATPLAVSPFVYVDPELDTIEEILFPLTDPVTGDSITLNDSSFSGSSYFVGFIYYNKDYAVAYGGEPSGTQPNWDGGTYFYNDGIDDTDWNAGSSLAMPFEHLLMVNPVSYLSLIQSEQLAERVQVLEDESTNIPRLILPDAIAAVVGYKQQLFFRGIIEDIDINKYNVKVTGDVGGSQYPRYYEFTPTAAGTKTFTISVYDKDNNLKNTNSCSVEIVAAKTTNPSTKKILCLGDSLTAVGDWTGELLRMLTGTGGDPVALNLPNLEFIGTVDKGSGNLFEGYGGKTWKWYTEETTSGDIDVEFVVASHDKDNSDLVSIWADDNGRDWKLETIVSTTVLSFSRVGHTSAPPSTGNLTHVSGAVHTSDIVYTSYSGGAVNPFWDSVGGVLDIGNYISTNGFTTVDCVYSLLTWNGMTGRRETADDHATLIAEAKVWIDNLHTNFPSCKVKLMGIQLPSFNGGLAANYGDANSAYGNYYDLVLTVNGLNLAYQELANDVSYSSFVDFVNISVQFDNENNMPEAEVQVNTRNATTENRGTNGVHPKTEGYYQIADSAFRDANTI